ncbi:A/G-specific adenine glycosylase [Poritiphilus flavus]|uniref:Adenine DNA glycosylase n=1 Tax=Poritiphilus flavus TaxID=2697053 RepID=A0A6L9ED41_9FLAO|nr:A/G-specific adenine glycosylase [Poritiphilus flavus]NAS12617.1 A/G-specific adenine glycosylase [Poritiphilus flavus]
MSFSEKILNWYVQNKRQLPWRNTTDPYKIWLSEIMLQQTRVAQGIPYYEKFVKKYPTVQDMAVASEQEILKLWQGLGYYSRARNMHHTARKVTEEMDGKFPQTYEGLIKLKGVGDYTASAIASISFGQLEPVVDGNVYRVLARYFGVDTPINSGPGIKYFKNLARELMPDENIRDYNQGLMEFGAIQCAPKKPYCLHCPLNDSCVALQKNLIASLPAKLKNNSIKKRYFNYLVPLDPKSNTRLHKREGKGIWQNLYEFPLIESPKELNINELKELMPKEAPFADLTEVIAFNADNIVHKLSHQHLYTRFWICRTSSEIADGITPAELEDYPVPVLIADFIKTLKISYF